MNHSRYIVPFVLLLTSVFCFGQKAKHTIVEQASFCEDGAPDDLRLQPTALPLNVVSAVMNTEQGKDATQMAENEHSEFDPAKMLKGTKIHLSDSGGRFFIVMGSYPMSGADNTWFWIVRERESKAKVLAFAGGNCLALDDKKTLGYRDVVTTWSSPSETITTTYVYDGKQYKMARKSSRPNK